MYPEYPVEVLFVHAKEVAIVLSENNGGRPGRVCNQGQLPKVVTLVERAHHTLRPKRNSGYTYATMRKAGPEPASSS